MNRVFCWIERAPGVVEQNLPVEVGYRWARDENGRAVIVNGRKAPDPAFAEAVAAALTPYNGQSAADVLIELSDRVLVTADGTGARQALWTALVDVRDRVQRRQRRAEAGTMRAPWLADVELAAMTVRVRVD